MRVARPYVASLPCSILPLRLQRSPCERLPPARPSLAHPSVVCPTAAAGSRPSCDAGSCGCSTCGSARSTRRQLARCSLGPPRARSSSPCTTACMRRCHQPRHRHRRLGASRVARTRSCSLRRASRRAQFHLRSPASAWLGLLRSATHTRSRRSRCARHQCARAPTACPSGARAPCGSTVRAQPLAHAHRRTHARTHALRPAMRDAGGTQCKRDGASGTTRARSRT
jgi:hypothetical protein